MNKILSLLILVSVHFIGLQSKAYFVAVPSDQAPLNYNQNVHILVSGRGTDLALQPQLAALTRGALYRQNFPDHQVVLISVIENGHHRSLLDQAGWTMIEDNEIILETFTVLDEVTKFLSIKSLEIFGHSSAIRGFQMDGDYENSIRFDPREPEVLELKSHFAEGAYAILYGCNSGWSMAQNLSRQWNIALAGTFTETQFERLHSDGHFYVEDTDFAPNSRWAVTNVYLGDVDCDLGGCTRMRPTNRRYIGWWGDFNGPLLSHFKFFCPLSVDECEMRMATSLYGFVAATPLNPDSDLDHFRAVAKEFLCPLSADRQITEECFEKLDLVEKGEGNKQDHFIRGNEQLVCDLNGCQAKIECDLENHNCILSDRVWVDSTTITDEYLHLINGFKALQALEARML